MASSIIPRRQVRRGRAAIVWENTVIGAGEIRYFVQCIGWRQSGSSDFRTLAEAEVYFDEVEARAPRASGW